MSADPLAPLLELPGVTDAVTTSRQAVDGLLGHRVLRRRSSDVSAESLLRGAWASAVLAGSPATLAELRAGTAEDPVLPRLHALAARGSAVESELGRPRPDPEVAHRLDVLAEVLDRTTAPAVVV